MTGKGEGLGATLRRERESRGIGLDELSRATKVRRVFLDALEEERWGELPAKIFVTGYLKAIAQHIGVEPSLFLSAYEGGVVVSEAPSSGPAAAGGSKRSVNWALAAAIACAVAVAAALCWIYIEMRSGPAIVETPPAVSLPKQAVEHQPAQAPAIETAQTNPTTTPVERNGGEPMAEQALPEPAVASPKAAAPLEAAATAPAHVTAAGQLSSPPLPIPPKGIVIETSGPCWVELYKGQERLVFRQMKAGERVSFDGGGFRLTAGDASVVKLFYDKKQIPLPDKPGTVVKEMSVGGAASEPPGR